MFPLNEFWPDIFASVWKSMFDSTSDDQKAVKKWPVLAVRAVYM